MTLEKGQTLKIIEKDNTMGNFQKTKHTQMLRVDGCPLPK